MEMKLYKALPEFAMDLATGKPKTKEQIIMENQEMVFVEFPNCISTKTNRPFKWQPSYPDLIAIKKLLDEVERTTWRKEPRTIIGLDSPIGSPNATLTKWQVSPKD